MAVNLKTRPSPICLDKKKIFGHLCRNEMPMLMSSSCTHKHNRESPCCFVPVQYGFGHQNITSLLVATVHPPLLASSPINLWIIPFILSDSSRVQSTMSSNVLKTATWIGMPWHALCFVCKAFNSVSSSFSNQNVSLLSV